MNNVEQPQPTFDNQATIQATQQLLSELNLQIAKEDKDISDFVNGDLSITAPCTLGETSEIVLLKIPLPKGRQAFQREINKTITLKKHDSDVSFCHRDIRDYRFFDDPSKLGYYIGDYLQAEQLGIPGQGKFQVEDVTQIHCDALMEEVARWQEFPVSHLSPQERANMKPMFANSTEWKQTLEAKSRTGLRDYLVNNRHDLQERFLVVLNDPNLVDQIDQYAGQGLLVHGDLKLPNVFFDDDGKPTFFDVEDMRVIDNQMLGIGYDFGRLYTFHYDSPNLQQKILSAWEKQYQGNDKAMQAARLGVLYWTVHNLAWYTTHDEFANQVEPFMKMFEQSLKGFDSLKPQIDGRS